MRWSVPAFPVLPTGEPAEPPALTTVDDAFLTRVELDALGLAKPAS